MCVCVCTLSHACHAKATSNAHRPTPATQKRRRPREGRQGVHPTPWQCTLSRACQAKEAETQRRQRDARAYIRGGDPGTPEGRQGVHPPEGRQGVHPWQCTLSHACHARGGDPGTPEGRQGVHPTPWQCTLSHACHAKEAETQGRQRDASTKCRACHAKE